MNTALKENIQGMGLALNPMVLAVEIGASDFPSSSSDETLNSTMRQVEVAVVIDGNTYKFSTETDNGDTVTFDISQAYRAALQVRYGGISPKSMETLDMYPVASGSVAVYLRYVLNGEMITGKDSSSYVSYGTVKAIYGGVSEYERLVRGTVDPNAVIKSFTNMSIKPESTESNPTEVVNVGDTVLLGEMNADDGVIEPYRILVTTDSIGKVQTCRGAKAGRSVYVENNALRHEFWFINSLGMMENVSALMMESHTVHIESEEMALVSTPSFIPSGNISSYKSGYKTQWKMSSGPVNGRWTDWWVNEFLMADRHWLRLSSGIWLPVAITPDDEDTSVYDRTSDSVPSINFTVTSGINGRVEL